jgi:GT2 family glycosyltransferase
MKEGVAGSSRKGGAEEAGGSRHTSVAIVVPSLGSPTLPSTLAALEDLHPAPATLMLVLSGPSAGLEVVNRWKVLRRPRRLGFAAAVNLALAELDRSIDAVALVNDDATPNEGWLRILLEALQEDRRCAAVQGTVTDRDGETVDGRGITLDRFGLPVQVDRARRFAEGSHERREVLAVSATAALFRLAALREASWSNGDVFDPRFDSYHEDLDLGLRLRRLGWRAAWVSGAATRHLGSESGMRMRWHHPWWLLVNRWRALAGNLSPKTTVRLLPRLLRGELRAVRTLARDNPRALPVALAALLALPAVVVAGWERSTPGPRLEALPGAP